MSKTMSPQKYFEFINNSRFLPYGMDYSLLNTNERLTVVAIHTLNNTNAFR